MATGLLAEIANVKIGAHRLQNGSALKRRLLHLKAKIGHRLLESLRALVEPFRCSLCLEAGCLSRSGGRALFDAFNLGQLSRSERGERHKLRKDDPLPVDDAAAVGAKTEKYSRSYIGNVKAGLLGDSQEEEALLASAQLLEKFRGEQLDGMNGDRASEIGQLSSSG